MIAVFLSTPSARRATPTSTASSTPSWYFYPRPPRGGRLQPAGVQQPVKRFLSTPSARRATLFLDVQLFARGVFLSTPSARRATSRSGPTSGREKYFYPRPPRGGRHLSAGEQAAAMGISIHALREEGDSKRQNLGTHTARFLSTPSARRATASLPTTSPGSVHFYPRPPRGGRLFLIALIQSFQNFYPRPPRGGRLQNSRWKTPHCLFLSTPSARRAT